MILPLNAIWGGVAFNPLDGNAQVFDGSFDYDTITAYQGQAQAQPFSQLIDVEFITKKITIGLYSDVISGIGLELFIESTGKVRFLIVNGSGNLYFVNTSEVVNTGRNNFIFTWNGSTASIYLNGTALTINTIANTLSGYLAGNRTATIGARGGGTDKLLGKYKTLEVINKVANAQEIADAAAGGSFRSAGIGYGSGQYLLAVDFNKQDGEAPTTFAGTPSYIITAFGGATYTPYL